VYSLDLHASLRSSPGGLRPAGPPTRSLAGPHHSPLRSRGSLAALVR
jgi:hypothetical protein